METSFLDFDRPLQEALVAALSPLDFYGDFVSSEAALGAVQERLRPLSGLRELPKRLLEEVGRLLNACERAFKASFKALKPFKIPLSGSFKAPKSARRRSSCWAASARSSS